MGHKEFAAAARGLVAAKAQAHFAQSEERLRELRADRHRYLAQALGVMAAAYGVGVSVATIADEVFIAVDGSARFRATTFGRKFGTVLGSFGARTQERARSHLHETLALAPGCTMPVETAELMVLEYGLLLLLEATTEGTPA